MKPRGPAPGSRRPLLFGVIRSVIAALAPACVSVPSYELVITNVNVVDVRNGLVLPARDVVTSAGRIRKVAIHSAGLDGGADQVVDGTGKFLIPGLWDMHTHIFNNNDPAQRVNTWYFPSMLEQGVTGVRDMWVRPADVPTVERWQQGLSAGTWNGPRMLTFGCIVDGAHPRHKSDGAADPASGRALVRAYKQAGIGFVKVYDGMDRDTYLAILEEARRVGIDVAGHTPFSLRPSEVSAAGQHSIEHMGGIAMECSTEADRLFAGGKSEDGQALELLNTFSEERAAELGQTLRANQTWMVPTLCLWLAWIATDFDELQRMPGLPKVPTWERDEWAHVRDYYLERGPREVDIARRRFERDLRCVAILHAQGVRFLAGTDVGNEYILPGRSLHDELELFVQAGFTPAEALRTATSDAADYMNAAASTGQIAPGRFADMVLLDADPLDDIRNTRRVHAVILNGRVVVP